ncbi:hypothetical protein, partial [Oxalobacter formigenes]|uniref:hypothetical protein n=1 Tax=Oxalobacter formigenes TaxID=847 RepID=UPI00241F8354
SMPKGLFGFIKSSFRLGAGCLMPAVNKYKSETLQLLIHPFHGSSGHLWHICEDFSFLWSGLPLFLCRVVQAGWGRI